MSRVLLAIGLPLVLCLYVAQAQGRKEFVTDQARKKKGQEIWELAIAAKGGREKLEQVKSIAYLNGATDGDFIVFPDRFFRWADARGIGRNGFLIMSHFNFATRTEYSLTAEGDISLEAIKKRNLDFTSISNLKTWFEPYQLHYFLGVKWFHPQILDWQQKKYGGKVVDWVRLYPGTYEGDTDEVGIYFDPSTHLPMRVEHYVQYRYGEQVNDFIELKDYHDNKGIMMPTKVRARGFKDWSTLVIEINPEYDPTFFDRPPDPKLGFNQWRLKK